MKKLFLDEPVIVYEKNEMNCKTVITPEKEVITSHINKEGKEVLRTVTEVKDHLRIYLDFVDPTFWTILMDGAECTVDDLDEVWEQPVKLTVMIDQKSIQVETQ